MGNATRQKFGRDTDFNLQFDTNHAALGFDVNTVENNSVGASEEIYACIIVDDQESNR